ncbi:MAG: tetratricopeptide repeat protein [bacterium]|nr:tetratricopeptide repeat protein [bacterium]
MPGTRAFRWLRNLIDLAAVATAVGFIAGYFPADIMFADTLTNGGDMASHYPAAEFLRDVLLPRGEMVGWYPGNYCGFPLFQFYFPLPFVIIALLGDVIPLPIAFKLGTVLGTFLLPICTYLSLRCMRTPFPGPALGTLGTLCFLFMEANSMWGGNIPSTLAGEFALSLGLALTILFFGTLRRTMDTGRGVLANGVLVGLIGLSHGYTLLWAGFGSLAELVAARGWWRRFGILTVVHGLAILLIAFWLVPLIGYSPWTTAYNHSWPIRGWREVFPPILWPAVIAAVATGLIEAVVAAVKRRPYPRDLATLWAVMTVAALFWFLAFSFHVVDIRFVPFVQLGLCITAGAGLGHLLGRLPAAEIWPVVGACAVVAYVQKQVTFIPSWIRWNYSGFERKATWPVLKGIGEALRGTYKDPRVVYEHSPDNEQLGTVRAFESLPMFAGRSTLEGLYMQGSPTAPFVFYIQSEIGKAHSCPFPNWGCSRFDLDRGLEHLRMLNVSDFIVRSSDTKAAAAKNVGLEKVRSVGNYDLYRIRGNDPRYAVPLTQKPQLMQVPDWKLTSYQWFKTAGPNDVVPVFANEVTRQERELFSATSDGLPESFVSVPLPDPPALTEEMTTDRITVRGAKPGHPVLIRISYHPRWQSATGERVWLAGPSFMLVFPKGEEFELVFGAGPPVIIGRAMTLLGLLALVGALLPPGRRFGRRVASAARRRRALPPLQPVDAMLRAADAWSPGRRRAAVAVGLVVVGVGVGVFSVAARSVPAEQVYRDAQNLYNAGKLRESVPGFQEVQRLAPLSMTAIHARYFEAIVYYREQDWKKAEELFANIVRQFPDGVNAPEAQYHIGLCRRSLGDVAGAIAAFEATRRRYSDSVWARHAGERLAEIQKD